MCLDKVGFCDDSALGGRGRRHDNNSLGGHGGRDAVRLLEGRFLRCNVGHVCDVCSVRGK